MKAEWLLIPLIFAVLASAIGVVYSTHYSRKLFVELTELKQTRDELNVEWGQLQLEQSTWATHGRIEELAREKLNMKPLDYKQVIILKP
ncbi:MAG: cell division protein FtsL [Thiohalophilus sp.]|uniref:cell division protein FtsL n=1 Tax=Thiohalophilus sp. TaxID=3028392 RepID=UPI002870A15C|nr:cell division protein FtsL [Thiohalophilus sp.]MDR9435719.1 cell division protein FtsL [Thiohalophilus sp.]